MAHGDEAQELKVWQLASPNPRGQAQLKPWAELEQVPPFMQGDEAQELTMQVGCKYPDKHVQVKALPESTQVPPFMHGTPEQPFSVKTVNELEE